MMRVRTEYGVNNQDPAGSAVFTCGDKPKFGKLKALSLFIANGTVLCLILVSLIAILPQAGGLISVLSIPAGAIAGLLSFMQASDRGWL